MNGVSRRAVRLGLAVHTYAPLFAHRTIYEKCVLNNLMIGTPYFLLPMFDFLQCSSATCYE